jgi:hypothetical protein
MGSGPSQNDIGWNIDDILITGQEGLPAPQYALSAAVNHPAWGTVNPTNGTYPSGSSVQIAATPATYFRFLNWAGGTTGTNNPLTLVMNTNLSIQAVFGERLTTNHPTPLWWLASYGYTQNPESAVTNLGSNGFPLWQSYIAGLNPNDPDSQLRLFVSPGSGNSVVLHWNAVTGRVYTVWSSTNSMSAFAPITNAANLPATITGITNGPISSSAQMLYRLEVRTQPLLP